MGGVSWRGGSGPPATVNDTSIILADETNGKLVAKTVDEIRVLLENLCQQGNTVILVTTEADIARHARRSVQLRDGVVESDEMAAVAT